MNAKNAISKLPVNVYNKLRLYKKIREIYWTIKYDANKIQELTAQKSLVPQNSYYGHEYWLKKYSGYEKSILGLIEHGLTFRCDVDKDGWNIEWELGSILTFGNCRYDLLRELYPSYNIVRIGPRIHYAPVDREYYNELKKKLDPNKRTIVLYPLHSLATQKSLYNIDSFLEDALYFAKENDIGNILVSLHPSDILNGYDKDYLVKNQKLLLVSGGSNEIRFLPRLKAILSIADITYSNTVGTHTGYSIYMNKPQIINPKSDSLDSEKPQMKKCSYNYLKDYKNEKEKFIKAFNGSNPWNINSEQRELIDEYFGISYIKSKEQLYKELEGCEKAFRARFN